MGFLDQYAKLDYLTKGISIQSGFFHRPQDGSALFVEDPLQPGRMQNIAKATFAMDQVKAAFWHAQCALEGRHCGGKRCSCSRRGSQKGQFGSGGSRLSRVLISHEWELPNVFTKLDGPVC